MQVVATAGHVDHGKSTLVRALTGMEPDRWAEERRRGMTIDLGYAWTALPSGATLAFVDVPGHARFIGNMLAGLGPAPAVLFVVAADEGWRRQSTEHLAAVDALGLAHGLLAVTRSDLADPAPAIAQSLAHLARTSLGKVAAVAVSGHTGAGLPALVAALERLAARQPAPRTDGPVRLWVDRAFSVRGAGTVVTGTLGAGTLRVGDALELHGRPVRVRGLQSLGQTRDEVPALARVAVNLRGASLADVSRGDALLSPDAWPATDVVDARVTASGELPPELMLHVGSTAVAARIRPLGPDAVRLHLSRPLPLRAGDRALLRDPGRQEVAGGVLVLDADPPQLRRRGAAGTRGQVLAASGGRLDPAAEVARRGAMRVDDLARLTGTDVSAPAGVRREGGWLVSDTRWAGWVEALTALVTAAARSPLDPGVAADAARHALGLPDLALVAPLAMAAGVRQQAGRLLPAQQRADLGPAEQAVAGLEQRLREAPFAAPEADELAAAGLGLRELAAAERAGRLLRLSGGVVLRPDGPALAMRELAALPGPFTLSQARQALGTTRRVAVPLLEHLDRRGWTRRVDSNLRTVVRRGAS